MLKSVQNISSFSKKTLLNRITLTFLCLVCAVNVNAQLSSKDSVLVDKLTGYATHFEENGNKLEASKFNDKVAFLYWRKNMGSKAEMLYLKSLSCYKELKLKDKIASTSSNLGLIYASKKNFDKAIEFFSVAISENAGNSKKLISDYKDISTVYLKKKDFTQSIAYSEKALTEAEKINDQKNIQECYGNLAEAYKKDGNDEKSLYYYNLFLSNQANTNSSSNEVVVDNNSSSENENTSSNTDNESTSENETASNTADFEEQDNSNGSTAENDTTHSEVVANNDSLSNTDEVEVTEIEEENVKDSVPVEVVNESKKSEQNGGIIVFVVLAVLVLLAIIIVFATKKRTVKKKGYEIISHVRVGVPEVPKKQKYKKRPQQKINSNVINKPTKIAKKGSVKRKS